jgi:quercetin dioxygenase-like cupin family protein
MPNFTNYRNHVGSNPERQFKSTMFKSPRLMLGLNCLEPGQSQNEHTHDEQDKFYFEGVVVWAPSGVSHGVSNNGKKRLVLLVGIAPFPGK